MKLKVDISLTAEQLAMAFCEADSHFQAAFFVHCARIAESWDCNASFQWDEIGQGLNEPNSTEEARQMVIRISEAIMDGMTKRVIEE